MQSSVGVFTTHLHLIVQVWDDTLARLTGIVESAASGQSLTSLVPTLEARGLLSRFQRVLDEGVIEVLAPALHHYLIPCRPQTPSRRFDQMQQRVVIAPLRDGDLIAGLMVTVEDVTERLERESQLKTLLASGDEHTRLRAAEAISDDDSYDATSLVGALADESWKVRRMAIRGVAARDAPEAIAALLKSVRENHGNPALLNSALQVLASTGVDTLSPLLEFLEGPDPDLRMQAALALGEQHDARAIKALVKALADNDSNVRYHAIEALGKLRAAESVDALLEIVETRDFFLSFVALEALEQIGDARVAPAIVPLLSDEFLREPAARLLGHLGDESVVAPLTAILNTPVAPTVVIADMLATLSDRYEEKYGEGEHIADLARPQITAVGYQNLLDALDAPGQEKLRSLARVIGWLDHPGVDRALTRLMGRAELRDEIVAALVQHGSTSLDLLVTQLAADDFEVRRSAVVALGRIGDVRAASALVNTLADKSLAVDAAYSLAQIADPQAVDGLISLLGNKDASIRHAAVSAINSLGVASVAQRIITLLGDPDPNIRESAVRIAGYFGFPEATHLLIELCDDSDERVRCAAIEHLAYVEDEQATAVLVRTINQGTAKARAAAVRALSNLDAPNVARYLTAGLSDEDMWVRYFSARGLGRRGSQEAIAVLERVIAIEKFHHVRIAALDSLGQIGGKHASGIVAKLLGDEDTDLALAAVSALGKIEDAAVLAPLRESLRSSRPEIRAGACDALGTRREAATWEDLLRVATTDLNDKVADKAILGLKQIGTEESIGALVALLESNRREYAANALADVSDDHIENVARGLSHHSALVRRATVEVLARIKRPRASEVIRRALADTDPLVRQAASDALGQMKG